MMIASISVSLFLLAAQFGVTEAFLQSSPTAAAFLPQSTLSRQTARQQQQRQQHHAIITLSASTDEETEKAAPVISGEELEMMMQDWETPLVVDAYATWYVFLLTKY